mmetsp:Transcript_20965/g.33942  ORF Transcript_20965/g.33942 Transcript_20965/m.33942 type:complete len:150 (-) Transcript_20965:167-616(-)
MFAVAQSVVAAAHRPVLPHQGRTTQTEPRPLRATKPAPRAVRAAATDDAAGEASGTSYYKIIDGVKYDRKVLDDCAKYEKNDGSIDIDEAKLILSDLLDGPARKVGGANETKSAVTNVELDTAQYAFDNFTWSPAAKDWFFEQLTSKNW